MINEQYRFDKYNGCVQKTLFFLNYASATPSDKPRLEFMGQNASSGIEFVFERIVVEIGNVAGVDIGVLK